MVGYDGPILFWRSPDWSPLLPVWLLIPGFALALAAVLFWLLGPASVVRRDVEARDSG
jgi:hypothetical protein